jgi:hypothetical protein
VRQKQTQFYQLLDCFDAIEISREHGWHTDASGKPINLYIQVENLARTDVITFVFNLNGNFSEQQ